MKWYSHRVKIWHNEDGLSAVCGANDGLRRLRIESMAK